MRTHAVSCYRCYYDFLDTFKSVIFDGPPVGWEMKKLYLIGPSDKANRFIDEKIKITTFSESSGRFEVTRIIDNNLSFV